jgi:two-component system, OmpR family, phosphate regulon sensor histidine kinase PhoR
MSLRAKILSTYIALTVLAVLAASGLSSWLVKSHLDRVWTNNLRGHVEMLAGQFEDGSLATAPLPVNDERLTRIARSLEIRLTLIRKDGRVLFDSEVLRDSLPGLENHLGRPEVRRAVHGATGSDKRHSVSTNRVYFYAARRVFSPMAGDLDSGFVRGALSEEGAVGLDSDVQAIIWWIGAVTILGIVAVSLSVARRISAPIVAISATARRITGGDIGHRVQIDRKDEIGDLGRSLNEMAGKLQSDIERLRKLERIRSEFLANVSHELRTPIFSIQGFLETLLDGAVDDPKVNRDFIEKAHRHAIRLNTLLTDLIDISRIESGEMKMSLRYFPADEFLGQVTEEMSALAARNSVSLSLHMEIPAGMQIFGDRDRLRQVMVNLVDNAVKYTEAGGAVRIRATADEERCTIRVEDSGIGIEAEHLPRLFERFYRVNKDRSRDVGGTGLGLAIVKHIVEAHGGTIDVRSTVGKGSVFSFTVKR